MLPYFFCCPVGIRFLLSDGLLRSVVGKCPVVKGGQSTGGRENCCKVSQGTSELVHPARSNSWRMVPSLLIQRHLKWGEIGREPSGWLLPRRRGLSQRLTRGQTHATLISLDFTGMRCFRILHSLHVLVRQSMRLNNKTGLMTWRPPSPAVLLPREFLFPQLLGWSNRDGCGLLCALCTASSLLLCPRNEAG